MGTEALEKIFLYWLCHLPDAGALQIRRIGEAAGGFQQAYYIEGTQLWKKGIFKKEENALRFDAWKGEFSRLEEEYYKLSEKGIYFITPLDEEYPRRLYSVYDYPLGLYVKGSLPKEDKATAAVIGARNCTAYGREAAGYMAKKLAAAGIQIISGMALGIDGAGHEGAMAAGGMTYAVLGCGVDQCYPRSNFDLYENIPFYGGLISEYPLKTPPVPRNFPIRNRIISGLSDVILVIEAKEKSGSLITAQSGVEQGKEIYALTGRITDALSTGCNQLIAEGAQVLFSPETVLENLGIFVKEKEQFSEKKQKGLAKKEKMVYSCLDSEPRHIEEIASKTGLSVSQSMDALLELELGGYAVRTAGLYYTKKLF